MCMPPTVSAHPSYYQLCGAVSDLEAAQALLAAPAGISGAVKQAAGTMTGDEDASWSGASTALTHDGRLNAKKLVKDAYEK